MDHKMKYRFPEERRYKWFNPNGNCSFLYFDNNGNIEFYHINESEQNIFKVDNKECVRLLKNTSAIPIDKNELAWLTNESKSKLKYFNSLDEYEKYEDGFFKNL